MLSFDQFAEAGEQGPYGVELQPAQSIGLFDPVTTTGMPGMGTGSPSSDAREQPGNYSSGLVAEIDNFTDEDKLLMLQTLLMDSRWLYRISTSYQGESSGNGGVDLSHTDLTIRILKLAPSSGGSGGLNTWGKDVFVTRAIISAFDTKLSDAGIYSDENLINMGVIFNRESVHTSTPGRRNAIIAIRKPNAIARDSRGDDVSIFKAGGSGGEWNSLSDVFGGEEDIREKFRILNREYKSKPHLYFRAWSRARPGEGKTVPVPPHAFIPDMYYKDAFQADTGSGGGIRTSSLRPVRADRTGEDSGGSLGRMGGGS